MDGLTGKTKSSEKLDSMKSGYSSLSDPVNYLCHNSTMSYGMMCGTATEESVADTVLTEMKQFWSHKIESKQK